MICIRSGNRRKQKSKKLLCRRLRNKSAGPFTEIKKKRADTNFVSALFCWILQLVLDLIEAIGADAFAVEEDDIVSVVAENAGGVIFL